MNPQSPGPPQDENLSPSQRHLRNLQQSAQQWRGEESFHRRLSESLDSALKYHQRIAETCSTEAAKIEATFPYVHEKIAGEQHAAEIAEADALRRQTEEQSRLAAEAAMRDRIASEQQAKQHAASSGESPNGQDEPKPPANVTKIKERKPA